MPKRYADKLLYWASEIEDDTLEQAARTSRLPFVEGHVALMPDAHVGFGSTVGSVIPTKGAIIPSAIGVDIGCGMIATETIFREDQLPDSLDHLLSEINRLVPAGVGQGHGEHRSELGLLGMPNLPLHFTAEQEKKAISQFGSLGSGNHFVEVSVDERGQVWTVLHSGSRGIGNQLASAHIDRAKGIMKSYFIDLEDSDLAYLVEGTEAFDNYIMDMTWAQEYAMESRAFMNDSVLVALEEAILGTCEMGPAGVARQVINCHHNYTERENHRGKKLWITRKGAIKSAKGDLGVIPGSMGTDTFIVRGKGNATSFNSSSHGAGRRMSRGQARRLLNVDDFQAKMAGKTWQSKSASELLDEHPSSYKDIATVMDDQKDLVEVVHRLEQRLNYKGTK